MAYILDNILYLNLIIFVDHNVLIVKITAFNDGMRWEYEYNACGRDVGPVNGFIKYTNYFLLINGVPFVTNELYYINLNNFLKIYTILCHKSLI